MHNLVNNERLVAVSNDNYFPHLLTYDHELGLPTTVVVVPLLDQHGPLEASPEDRTTQPKLSPLPPPPQDAPRL